MSHTRLSLTLCVMILMAVFYSFSHAAGKSDKSKSKDKTQSQPKLRALIIDGQNNHDWKTTEPLLQKALESSGRFNVEVATTPAADQIISEFKPNFANYDVV